MIKINKGSLWVACDVCSETRDLKTTDHPEAVLAIKKAGWEIRHVHGGGFQHICPMHLDGGDQCSPSDYLGETEKTPTLPE